MKSPASLPDPDEAPIFVVGTGRSGTTLLRLMLNAHPRIYLTHEASFYVTAPTFPRSKPGSEWLDYYVRTLPFAWLKLSPAEVRRELPARFGCERLPDAFRAVMRCAARRNGRVRYGDKTPFHASQLKHIFDDFPGAKVIHAVRDPRATVASLARMPWAPGSLSLSNVYCAKEFQEVWPYRDRVHEVRLEDLLAGPRRVMTGVLDFLGEPWSDAVLDHPRHAPADVPPFPWLLPAGGARVAASESWREQLSPAWIRLIERTNRNAMAAYGYESAKLDREPGRLALLGAAFVDMPRSVRAAFRFVSAFGKLANFRTPPVVEAQQLLLHLNPDAWRHYPGFEIPTPPEAEGG